MAVLPVPEVVKEMAAKIDKMAKALEGVDQKVQRLQSEFNEIKTTVQPMAGFGNKLDILRGEMQAMKESIRIVTNYVERK
jgi:uncharacterized coiled-coil DUF342 family protein